MTILVKGQAAPDVAATAAAQSARDALGVFGEALIGVWAIHLSPERLPGVAAVGDAIGRIDAMAARRDTFGRAPAADGRGAPLAIKDGALAADCTTVPLWTDARPVDRTSFGLGMLYNFTPAALASTSYHMGNDDSNGGSVPATLRRSVGGSVDQLVTWKGITSAWLRDTASASAQADARIEETGWRTIAVDEHGGNSAMAIDRRDPVIAPTDGQVPTLNSVRFGGSSDANPGKGAVAAFMVCDGPLVQDAARRAAWQDFCAALLRDLMQ